MAVNDFINIINPDVYDRPSGMSYNDMMNQIVRALENQFQGHLMVTRIEIIKANFNHSTYILKLELLFSDPRAQARYFPYVEDFLTKNFYQFAQIRLTTRNTQTYNDQMVVLVKSIGLVNVNMGYNEYDYINSDAYNSDATTLICASNASSKCSYTAASNYTSATRTGSS